MESPVCELLNLRYPIVQAPIGSATCPELAAAVSNAGGLGMIAASWLEIDTLRETIRKTKRLTDSPFGVNLVLEWPQRERLDICLEEGVQIISTFWGDPSGVVKIAKDVGAIVIHTVGKTKEAEEAVEKGVDIIVGQGWEAGGHVYGNVSLQMLIPAIVKNCPGTPVIAAGGIADGKGIVSAFSLGASGVWMGTRFVASKEAAAHPFYKQKIVESSEDDTVLTQLFDIGWSNASHRVIRNSTLNDWEKAGSPPTGERPNEHELIATNPDGKKVLRYSDSIPIPGTKGNLEAMALYAGQSTGCIKEIKSAAEIIEQLVLETKQAKEELGIKLEWAN